MGIHPAKVFHELAFGLGFGFSGNDPERGLPLLPYSA
jgi:hypothetical protein